jgi:hypothetical protein
LELSNRYGEFPFEPLASASEGCYKPNVYRPNPRYYDYVDRLIRIAANLGITLSLVPAWGRWINGGIRGPPVLFDTKSAYSFGSFLGYRYPFQPFILGGDTNRYWNEDAIETIKVFGDLSTIPVVDYGAITEAMAKGILDGSKAAIDALDPELASVAKGYKAFITYHSTQGK